ncbi:phage head spike fiber domain-containing protein [Pontivivens nitratireducens]|uniref:Uncharacterized protein n=1 Tax=Pontivivens nitratireducens TaxID=2758038 RepID=A0A6G7VR55_9RHOB|nr:hypothetical protein [Pontibrevibacter nitratireducens]QIK42338.1 hypothetical protein G8E03_15950 [Pontibrevibacter nitratireducens]
MLTVRLGVSNRAMTGLHPIRIAGIGGLGARAGFTRAGSATAFDAQGQIATYPPNIQRPAHAPHGGARLGTVIEGEATNLVPYSAATSATWENFGASSQDLSVNALGLFPGVRVISHGSVSHRLNSAEISMTGGQAYALRLFLQAGSSPSARLIVRAGSSTFSMVNGAPGEFATVSDGAGEISVLAQTVLPDSTIMCDVVFIPAASDLYTIGIGPNSGVEGEDVILLALQCEAGTAPTSYIPTTDQPVTRMADRIAISGVSGVFDVYLRDGDGLETVLDAIEIGDGYRPDIAGSVLAGMLLIRA